MELSVTAARTLAAAAVSARDDETLQWYVHLYLLHFHTRKGDRKVSKGCQNLKYVNDFWLVWQLFKFNEIY